MPRLAATVMLIRPAESAPHLEVFMLRRSAKSAFAPDVFVFPGGTLDAADTSDEALAKIYGPGVEALGRIVAPREPELPGLPDTRAFAGLHVTALRELFEEAGVLLACTADGRQLSPDASQRVHAGARAYDDALADLAAFGDARSLQLFSRWVTPPDEPQRYDAYFFAAAASREHSAAADAFETHDGVWIAPREALTRSATGSFRMIYPTIKHVERLADFTNVRDLMAFAAEKPIHTLMPQGALATGLRMPDGLENAW